MKTFVFLVLLIMSRSSFALECSADGPYDCTVRSSKDLQAYLADHPDGPPIVIVYGFASCQFCAKLTAKWQSDEGKEFKRKSGVVLVHADVSDEDGWLAPDSSLVDVYPAEPPGFPFQAFVDPKKRPKEVEERVQLSKPPKNFCVGYSSDTAASGGKCAMLPARYRVPYFDWITEEQAHYPSPNQLGTADKEDAVKEAEGINEYVRLSVPTCRSDSKGSQCLPKRAADRVTSHSKDSHLPGSSESEGPVNSRSAH